MKRKVVLTMSGLVLLGLLAGCSTEKEGKEKKSNRDKKVELTIHGGTVEAGAFDGEWPIFKEAEKKTNVSLKGVIPDTVTDFNQSFSLMMASGDIADIVLSSNLEYFKYGVDGAFEPLEDLVEKNAPHLKKFLDDNPEVKSIATGPDGHLWFIPFVQDGEAQSGWFIRQDWLDKLNLKTPKSLDELHKTLLAFANEDPNGNGKKDEIPYFHRNPTSGINDLLSLWDAHPTYFVKGEKVNYGPLTNEFIEGYKNISDWYKEGIIDKEIYTRANARDVLLADNQGGVTHDLFASTGNYNDKLPEKIEGFIFKPMAPPANINGKQVEPTKRKIPRTYGWGMSASNPDKEATIKYFDYWFTEEGRRAANYGIEGDTYEMKDGKPILTDKVLNGNKPAVDVLRETGAQANFGFQQDYEYEKQWTNKIALEGINEYVKNNYFEEQYPDVKFTTEEQKEIEKIVPKVDTFISESTQQWVLGSKDIDGKTFQSELKKLGAERLVEINQKAYDRYVKEIGK